MQLQVCKGLSWAPVTCFSAGSDNGLNERNAEIADYSSSHKFRQ